jgi:hypothetical protein
MRATRVRIDPRLKPLEKLVGKWRIRGRTLDSRRDNIHGTVDIGWLPGGFLMQQRGELRYQGRRVRSLEIVGHDPTTGSYPSYVYTDLATDPLPYRWEILDDGVLHSGMGATFRGVLSRDGKTLSGGWRPASRRKSSPGNSYDVVMTRAR